MQMARTKLPRWLVPFAAALGVALLIAGYFALRGGGDEVDDLSNGVVGSGGAAVEVSPGPGVVGALAEGLASGGSTRAAAAGTAGPLDDGQEQAAIPGGGVEVEVVVAANPWLAADTDGLSLLWAPAGLPAEEYTVELEGARGGRFELPGAPSAATEFSKLILEGFVLRVDSLEALAAGNGPAFRLGVSLEQGATLRWADAMRIDDRFPVDVALGGYVEPPSRKAFGREGRRGVAAVRGKTELPITLPRLVQRESVWVGASGFQWASFSVEPESREVAVMLAQGASIKVLHDPPSHGERQFIHVTAFPEGFTQSEGFDDGEPMGFSELRACTHEVWVANDESRGAEPISRVARIDLAAGESYVVDLTSEHSRTQLGSLRIHVHVSPETLELAGGDLEVRISRRAEGPAAYPWEHAGILRRLEDAGPGERVYGALGLEPGLHRVSVIPFGAFVKDRIVLGEVHEVEIRLDQIGWVKLIYPDDYPEGSGPESLTSVASDFEDRTFLYLGMRSGSRDSPRPVAAGTYTARVSPIGEEGVEPLGSAPFVVRKGATTSVVLEPQPQLRVNVQARDLVTEEPIALGTSFWVKVAAVNLETDKALLRSAAFSGNGSAYSEMTWSFHDAVGLVRIELPDDPLWAFEAMEPLTLENGATIVLRARAKD